MLANNIWVVLDFVLFLALLCGCINNAIITRKGILLYSGVERNTTIILGILLFCIYNKTEGDYFHYKGLVEMLSAYPNSRTHLEYPYRWLISILGNNYFLFRLSVWGLAFLFLLKILSLNKLKNNIGLFSFILIGLIAFAYVRASVGITMFYLGYTLLYKEDRKFFDVFGGVILIGTSYFFHSSIVLLIVIAVGLFIVRMNKYTIILSFLALPFIVALLNAQISSFFSENTDVEYFAKKNLGLGIAAKFQLILFLTGVGLYSWSWYRQNRRNKKKVPMLQRKYLAFVFVLFYISMTLSFIDNGVSDLITRSREMAYVPLALLVGYSIEQNGVILPRMRLGLLLIMMSDFCYFVYMFYLKSIGSGI